MRKIRLQFIALTLIAFALAGASLTLSKRKVETVKNISNDTFDPLVNLLILESNNLSKIYLQKLNSLAHQPFKNRLYSVSEQANKIETIEAVFLIESKNNQTPQILQLFTSSPNDRPTLALDNSLTPLTQPTFYLKQSWLKDPTSQNNQLIINLKKTHALHLTQINENQSIAIITNFQQLQNIATRHLAQYLQKTSPLLTNDNYQFQLSLDDSPFVSILNIETLAKTADIVVHPSIFGDWKLQTWHSVHWVTSTHVPTLITGLTLATTLLSLAFITYQNQKKTLSLATQKVSFVNRFSHELGTPLTNILLNLELAERQIHSNPKESRDKLNNVKQEVARLTRLVENVLTSSKKESNTLRIHLTPCNPNQIITSTLQQFTPSLKRKNVNIHTQLNTPSPVKSDPDILQQILGNLISNVEKHAYQGHYLYIKSSYSNSSITILVKDRGTPIPRDLSDSIFLPFQRLSAELNEGSSGTGLGLAISKDLAELLGGSLTLTSDESGNTFTLKTPTHLS
ncbi:sensor histidine kinase [Rubritalea tangerina]|uniref:histidine kinase n=1 Tax=Rubritalea tangerina TaxID=430798 RepID=A0ABW4ZCU9_9BACT